MRASYISYMLVLSVSAASALAGIRGPVMGFVADTSLRALRPVNGMPGAALLGAPVEAGMPVDRAAVDASRGLALIAENEEGRAALLRGLGGEVTATPIEGALTRVDRIVLGPSASTAALYSPELGRVQLISGLHAEPRVSEAVDVSAIEAVSAIAVDDNGAILLAAAGGIHAIQPGAHESALLVSAQDPSALVLWGEGFLFADRAANEIVAASARDGFPALTVIAQERDGVLAPGALVISRHRLLIGNAQTLLVWDLTAGVPVENLELPAPATALRLLGPAISLNDPGEAPLWLIDGVDGAEQATARVWFVPAAAGTR